MAQQHITLDDMEQLLVKITARTTFIHVTSCLKSVPLETRLSLLEDVQPVITLKEDVEEALAAFPTMLGELDTKRKRLSSQLILIENMLEETNIRLQRAERLQQEHFIPSYRIKADVLESMVQLTEDTIHTQLARIDEMQIKMLQIYEGYRSMVSTLKSAYDSLQDSQANVAVHTTGMWVDDI